MKIAWQLVVLVSSLGLADVSTAAGWTSLFDGKSLDGWTQRNGTATYRVEDGAIVGRTTKGSPNSFLCTDRSYGDFELRFEVKVDDRLNSGVQVRSRTREGKPQGRVNGPQVEIEASGAGGAEAGYLYGEAAGGWMTPKAQLKPHKHFRDGEWNAYRVLAVGARIRVWINDVPISDLVDAAKYATHPHGFIGLQVHGVGQGGPFEVAWRNLEIREVTGGGDRDGWVDLYDGRGLAGWKTTGHWVPREHGVLAIEPRAGERGWQRFDAYLWSEKKYRDFTLDLEYSYPRGGNSGVFFRVGDTANPVKSGIEAQILDSSRHTGDLTHHDHGGIIGVAPPARNMSLEPDQWNRMRITCRGSKLEVILNDQPIHDLDLSGSGAGDRPLEGYIGLQDHGEPHRVRFRHIRIKEHGGLARPAPEPVEPVTKRIALFNGRDLDGWVADVPEKDRNPDAPESFVVRDGLLVSLGKPQGHLVTEGRFRDYRLHVVYRFPGRGGNCGVLVHASRPRALYGMFPASIECQLQSGHAGDFWCIQEDIRVPDMETRRPRRGNQKWGGAEGDSRRIVNLTDDSENPVGEWNSMIIECRGRTIKVWVNGDLVNHGSDCSIDRGKTALQAEGTEVEFRRVELEPLRRTAAATHYRGRRIARTMHWKGAEWLLRETRESEEHTSVLMGALGVESGDVVCDLGCGNGFHTLRLAELVGGAGRVYAVDIQQRMLDMLEDRMDAAGHQNIELVLGAADDPRIAAESCDLILLVDVYHELGDPEAMLGHMRRALKPDGRIALVEFRAEDPDVPIKKLHKMSKQQILAEFLPAGFRLVEEFDGLPWQHLMFFARDDGPRANGTKWIPLFNGEDLEGWSVKFAGHELGENVLDTFRVEGGVLKVDYGDYQEFDGRFGHIFYERPFSHYRLRVEYRFVGEQVAGGPGWAFRNNGVMLHSQSPESMDKNQKFPASIEVQLLGGTGDGKKRTTANVCTPSTNIVMDGKLVTRHCIDSTSETYHGDRWVTVEVEVRGAQVVKHIIDGRTVFEYTRPQLDERDAIARRLLAEGATKLLDSGYIALQAESHPTEFRRIELLELAPR